MHAEISYDLIMEDDMDFVEGTYRLPGGDWQVFIFTRDNVSEPNVAHKHWQSGVTGLVIRFPRAEPLNKRMVEKVLSDVLGVSAWIGVQGPDSIMLR